MHSCARTLVKVLWEVKKVFGEEGTLKKGTSEGAEIILPVNWLIIKHLVKNLNKGGTNK